MLRFTKVIFNNQWNLSEEKSERAFETPCMLTVRMSRRFIKQGAFCILPIQCRKKYYPYNVVLFDLKNL